MRKPPTRTLAEVRSAFETGRVSRCSTPELQEFLIAVGAETIADPAERDRTAEMGATMRQLLASRQSRQPSKLATLAVLLALAALLCSGAQAYYSWMARTWPVASRPEIETASAPEGNDVRIQASLTELARRSPSIRSGTLQAWWAGEQARQVQRLEAQAKRQTLAGDREGAARSISRADAIRSGIVSLADYEKPPVR